MKMDDKNTKNGRKLLEPTYDDNGQLISLSKRFNSRNDDARFSLQRDGDADYERKMNDVNSTFNEQIINSRIETIGDDVFNLGYPSDILLTAGIDDKPIKLYGSKILKKLNEHFFTLNELFDLPKAVADPIAVFKTNRHGHVILTELKIGSWNAVVAIGVGKGNDVEFDIVNSIYGKNDSGIIYWITNGDMVSVNKAKALQYLRTLGPLPSTTEIKELLNSAAEIIQNFDSTKSFGKKMKIL